MKLFLNISKLSSKSIHELIDIIESYGFIPADGATYDMVNDWIMIRGIHWVDVFDPSSIVHFPEEIIHLSEPFDTEKLRECLEIIRNKNQDIVDALANSLKVDINLTPDSVNSGVLKVNIRLGEYNLGRVVKKLYYNNVNKAPAIR